MPHSILHPVSAQHGSPACSLRRAVLVFPVGPTCLSVTIHLSPWFISCAVAFNDGSWESRSALAGEELGRDSSQSWPLPAGFFNDAALTFTKPLCSIYPWANYGPGDEHPRLQLCRAWVRGAGACLGSEHSWAQPLRALCGVNFDIGTQRPGAGQGYMATNCICHLKLCMAVASGKKRSGCFSLSIPLSIPLSLGAQSGFWEHILLQPVSESPVGIPSSCMVFF